MRVKVIAMGAEVDKYYRPTRIAARINSRINGLAEALMLGPLIRLRVII